MFAKYFRIRACMTTHEKKISHRDCSPWAHGDQNGHSQPWLSRDMGRDWAVTEPWSYWRCRDWAVTLPWLSCDLAVTELWPRRDWAVTSPSRDWAVIIGPRSRDHRGHRELTVSSPWPFIFSWVPTPNYSICFHWQRKITRFSHHQEITFVSIPQ